MAASGVTRQVSVRLTSTGGDDVRAQLEGVSQAADRLGTKTATIHVNANDDDWEADYQRVLEEAVRLGATRARITVDASEEDWEEKVARIQAMADALGLERVNIKVNANTDEAEEKIGFLQSQLASMKEGGLSLGNPYVLGAGAVGVASVAPALIGTAIGGGVGAAGVMGLYELDPQFKAAASKLGDTFKSTLAASLESGGSNSFATQVTGMLSGIGGFVKSEGPALTQMFQASVPFLKMFVDVGEQAGKIMLPAFTSAMKSMQPYLPQMEQGLVALVSGFAKFIEIIGPGMGPAATTFKTLMQAIGISMEAMGGIIDAVSYAIGGSIEASEMVIRGLMTLFSDAASTAEHAWPAVRNAITGALSGLASWAYSTGSNIIWGLINGIESGANALYSYVRRIANDISSAFKSVLGIFSPSRVFAEHGQNIVQGLALGITTNQHLATSAVRGLGAATSNGFAASYGRSGSSSNMQIQWVGGQGASDQLITWIKKNIRVRGGSPAVTGR